MNTWITTTLQRLPSTRIQSTLYRKASTQYAYSNANRTKSKSGSTINAKQANNNDNVLSRMLSWYSSKLESSPLLTKAITSGLIAAGGDILCQGILEEQNADNHEKNVKMYGWWDVMRTARFGFLGTFLVAPVIHVWFNTLSRLAPGTSMQSVLKRVAMDQFVFTPFFLPIWMTSMWTLENPSAENRRVIPKRLVDSLPPILAANWGLWVPCQVINFRFVPLQYQVLYSNVLGLLWTAYLSFSTCSAPPKKEQVEQEPIPM